MAGSPRPVVAPSVWARRVAAWVPAALVVPAVVAGAVAVSLPDPDLPELRAIAPIQVGTTWVYAVTDHGRDSGIHTKQVTGQAAIDASAFDAVTLAGHYTDYPGSGEIRDMVYLVLEDGALQQRGVFGNHEHLAVDPPAPAYQLPLDEGESWSYDGTVGTAGLRYTTTIEDIADTEVGGRTFTDCLHLVTRLQWRYNGQKKFNPEYTQEEWTCPGFGPVRTLETDPANDVEVAEELVEFHGETGDWFAEPPATPGAGGVAVPPGGTLGLDTARSNRVDGELSETLAWSDLRSSRFDFPPVADDEVMVLAERDGEVSAMDTATGAIRWRVRLTGPIVATPALAGEQVLVADSRKNLWSLHLADGTAHWVRRFDDVVSASPVVAGDRVVVATDDRHVTAVSLADSHTLWQAVRSTTLPAAPALAEDGDLVLVADRGGEVTAYNVADGSLAWTRSLEGGTLRGPAVADEEGVTVVADDTGGIYGLETGTGDLRWEQRTVYYPSQPFAVGDGRVVSLGDGTRLEAYSLEDGEPVWASDVDGTTSAPVLVGSSLVTATTDARLEVRDPSDGHLTHGWDLPVSGGGTVEGPIGLVADALVVNVDHDGPGLASGLYAYPVDADGARDGIAFDTVLRDAADGSGGPAVLAGDTMFVPGFDQAVYRVRADNSTTKLFQADGLVPGLAVAGDLLLAQKDKELRAYPVDGEDPVWTYPVPEGYPGQVPAASDDTVFVPLNQEGLAAVDRATGEERWRLPLSLAFGSTTPLVLPDGDVVYGGAALARYDATTGEQEWSILDGVLFGSAAYADGVVYGWVSRALGESGLGAYDAETGEELWFHANGNVPIGVGPAAGDGVLAAIDDQGLLAAYDARSGEPLWTLQVPTTVGGQPVILDGVVYVSEGGRKEDLYQRDYRISAHDLHTGRFLGSLQPPGSQFTVMPSVVGGDGVLLAPGTFTRGIVMIVRPR